MNISHITEMHGYPIVPGSLKIVREQEVDGDKMVQLGYTFAGENIPMPHRHYWVLVEELPYL